MLREASNMKDRDTKVKKKVKRNSEGSGTIQRRRNKHPKHLIIELLRERQEKNITSIK